MSACTTNFLRIFLCFASSNEPYDALNASTTSNSVLLRGLMRAGEGNPLE